MSIRMKCARLDLEEIFDGKSFTSMWEELGGAMCLSVVKPILKPFVKDEDMEDILFLYAVKGDSWMHRFTDEARLKKTGIELERELINSLITIVNEHTVLFPEKEVEKKWWEIWK